MGKPNYYLKSLFIQRDGTLINAARKLEIDEQRLGRLIHGRVRPKPEEMRRIAWHLQKPAADLFCENY